MQCSAAPFSNSAGRVQGCRRTRGSSDHGHWAMSYGPNLDDLYRKVSVMAGKILKGTMPADLPVERPARFEMVINLKAAKAFDLNISNLLLARADEVIE
jgi:ABC-type uncharacterized transport system substrate-binding protein